MKIYTGYKNPEEAGPAIVRVKDDKGTRVLDPKPSQAVWNHSPDGFQWGYGGSGPAQLALALLLDIGIAKWAAEAIHQAFKFEVVASLEPEWTKTEDELRAVADRLLKARDR